MNCNSSLNNHEGIYIYIYIPKEEELPELDPAEVQSEENSPRRHMNRSSGHQATHNHEGNGETVK